MPTPPPRKFFAFQLHLSTAIVLMFVAGGLIWANVHAWYVPPPDFHLPGGGVQKGWGYPTKHYGWPFAVVVLPQDSTNVKYDEWDLDYSQFALNVLSATVSLSSFYFLCEWLIRRRAARKGA